MTDYLTIREAADRLRISERSLRKYLKRGDLAYYRPDPRGKILIRWADVESWLESRRVEIDKDADAKEMLEALFGKTA
jgi:excisionase family DNA binding protein